LGSWTELGSGTEFCSWTGLAGRTEFGSWTELEAGSDGGRANGMGVPRRGMSRTSGRRPVRKPADRRRHVRSGSDLGDKVFDLPLGPMGGSPQERAGILLGEVRDELDDAAQVKTAIGQHIEKDGMLPRGSSRRDAQVGFGLGKVKDLGAVGEHRRGRLPGVEPALVDLADVSHEVRFGMARPAQKIGEATEQLVVGDGMKRTSSFHAQTLSCTVDRGGPIQALDACAASAMKFHASAIQVRPQRGGVIWNSSCRLWASPSDVLRSSWNRPRAWVARSALPVAR
jgi:hypothetical protein